MYCYQTRYNNAIYCCSHLHCFGLENELNLMTNHYRKSSLSLTADPMRPLDIFFSAELRTIHPEIIAGSAEMLQNIFG